MSLPNDDEDDRKPPGRSPYSNSSGIYPIKKLTVASEDDDDGTNDTDDTHDDENDELTETSFGSISMSFASDITSIGAAGGGGGSAVAASASAQHLNCSNNSSSSNNKDNNPTKTVNGGKATFLPSFRPAKLVPTKSSASSTLGATKSGARNMPKRKPGANLFNTTTKFRPQPAKTALRRRGGGAQALLKSGATASGGGAVLNKLGGGGSVGSSLNAAGRPRPGGINRLSGNRDVARVGGKSSRMKMIDDDDVDILTKLQQSNANSNMSAAELRASKRKRIASSFANQKKMKKQKIASPSRPGMQRMDHARRAPKAAPQQQQTLEAWQSLLRDRSNKLSGDDRIRVEKFFKTDKTERSTLLSPSEDGPVYKMKIHEQRGKDPATGEEIKVTFYLELDYNTGDFFESKKTKRY
mmetsp:Transcript_7570/g.14971  ORF Transcript_7570/g.14971 Transcript_7570/m.14971 type:complete len:412 (+) Transcript_7570:338-1573(+)